MFGSVFETNDCAKHFKLAKLSSKSHKKKEIQVHSNLIITILV
jgi:hypothetical protein